MTDRVSTFSWAELFTEEETCGLVVVAAAAASINFTRDIFSRRIVFYREKTFATPLVAVDLTENRKIYTCIIFNPPP